MRNLKSSNAAPAEADVFSSVTTNLTQCKYSKIDECGLQVHGHNKRTIGIQDVSSDIGLNRLLLCRFKILHSPKSQIKRARLSELHKFRWKVYTIPEKPIKAMARMPAVTSAIGIPFISLGISANSSVSRIPAKITSASPKPRAVAVLYTTLITKL